MGTLVCPLCCDEKFSNQLSLRYHLLSITDNVYCPECCQRFDSILQLADHLDGMCGKAELVNNIEEYTPDSDMVMAEGMAEEDKLIMHEGDTPETDVATEINNPGNMSYDVCKEVISVAANPQLDDLESVCLVSDGDIQEAAHTVIKNEYMDITKQELDVAMGHDFRGVMEQSYLSGNCEVMVHNSAGSQEALPEKLSALETNEFVGMDGQECGAVVDSFSLTDEAMSGSLEFKTILPEMECPGDRRMDVSEYSCSSCGITFGSVMEHIRMYHGGQEVVIEVPQAKQTALAKLIRASKTVLRNSDEQMTDMEVSPGCNDTSERAELQETIDVRNLVSTFSEIDQQTSDIHLRNHINALNNAAINSEGLENVGRNISFKEKTRVIADEEKIKQIVPGQKRVIPPVRTNKHRFSGELKYVSREVKIGRFWETRAEDVLKNDSPNRSNKAEVPTVPLPGEMKKENKRPLFKKDTRTSIEKLFSGNFLLKGTGGRGTRPGPYLGVNRVPEVKVIMSPGDKGTENAISVFTCSTCQKEFGNVPAFERHSCTIPKACMLVCKLCDEDVSDMKAMQVHMETIHDIKTEIPNMAKRKYNMQMLRNPVKCDSCDVTFRTIRSLKLHSKIHDRPKLKVPLECLVCHNLCSSNRTLSQHMKVHTRLLPVKRSEDGDGTKDEDMNDKEEKNRELILLVCKLCSKSFSNNEDLRVHWQEHLLQEKAEEKEEEGQKVVEQACYVVTEAAVPEEEDARHKKNTSPCVRCHKEIDKSCKEEHMAKHFSLLRYSCPVCNKSFSKLGHLNMHMQIHRGTKEYSCIHCGKIFVNMNLLRTHMRSHMVHRSYMCGFCGRGFFRPRDKVEHERIHTGEKPYPCSVCGMRFRVRYCLSLHMRRHTGVRPYNCKVCGKTFRTGTAFKAHTKIHLDERTYKCPFCPKKFKTLIQLLGHKKSHTKPYACVVCNRPFSSLYAVRKHMTSHEEGISGKAPLKFQCDMCGASYARSFALKDHLKIHAHNIPPAPVGKTCSDESSSDVS